MARNEITIPVFDGEDYSMWKKRITMYLKLKKCEKVIKRVKTAEDGNDWDENDLKATNYIYTVLYLINSWNLYVIKQRHTT